MHCKNAGPADVVERAEFPGFQDNREVRLAAGLFDGRDLFEDIGIISREKMAPGNHHVDFIRALVDRKPGLA